MDRKWTPAQEMAMSARGRSLLISAAAGSGKTATLTERIIRRLTDQVHPIDLSRLLIVTFTRAAASELKERISEALSKAIAQEPGNRHLQKQLLGLGSAHISTIDAFCREPVKEHFGTLGLPASLRIADEAELAPLRESILGELIEKFYLRNAPELFSTDTFSLLWGNIFANLCDGLTSSKNDVDLIPNLLHLYDRLLSFPEGLEKLHTEAVELENAASEPSFDFFSTRHGKILSEWLTLFCQHGIPLLEEAIEDISPDPNARKAYLSAFENDLSLLQQLSQAEGYSRAYDLFHAYENQRLGALRNADPIFVTHKERRTELLGQIKSLRETYFIDPPEIVRQQFLHTSSLCHTLYDLLHAYDSRILQEKKKRGICDFTDNRRYLLSLLRDPAGKPSGIARELYDRFDEVYIDEYQDVDEMQDEIFRLVGGDHRFMVGDIKQSIYGFRGADPSVFARYRRDLPLLASPEAEIAPQGNSIFMSDNFRCDESVIRVTNAVCGHIFRACPESIGYMDQDDLGFAKKPPEGYSSPAVSVSILRPPSRTARPQEEGEEDTLSLSGEETEAIYVANEVARLLRDKVPLANGRPVRPSDIVILMRNLNALPTYMRALTARGIPTGSEELEIAEAGRDLLHGSDMSFLMNLLRVLDDPDADIPLSEVLRAPFPGLDLEELITLRCTGDTSAESHSLYAGIEEYVASEDSDPVLREKLTAFMTWLERYRRLSTTHSIGKLLRLLRRDPQCACRETPAFRYLYESARTYRASSFVSLCSFLRYFETKLTTTRNPPVSISRDGGHVSIMTIHKSKGLEFPVCFVVRCGQPFSTRSYTADMIFEKRAGVSMKLYYRKQDQGGRSQYKTDTTLRQVSALAVKLTEREEEMRVLYVAMTRARERLYLVGIGNDKNTFLPPGDRFATLSGSCYLKWILAGLDANPWVAPYAEVTTLSMEDIHPEAPLTWDTRTHAVQEDSESAARYAELASRVTRPSPLEEALQRIPTMLPASRMREGLLDQCVFYDTDQPLTDGKLPDGRIEESWCDAQSVSAIRQSLELMKRCDNNEFELLLGENRRPTAAEKGTAAHLFLQFCHYPTVLSRGLEEEIARLIEEGFISQRAADVLDRPMLTAFFSSRFFSHIKEAQTLKREFRFSRFVPLATLTEQTALAEALGDKTLLIQGSIDLLCFFPDGHIELCDYKTDHITSAERADPSLLQARLQERHGHQLAQYAAAVEETFGARPTHAYVFSLPLGEALEIDL